MSLNPDRPEFDFSLIRDFSVDELLVALTDTHTKLANLHEEIAFNKAIESQGDKTVTAQRIRDEGLRASMEEKKWLIVRLLDMRRETDHGN